MKGKYLTLSEKEIEKNLQQGIFKEDPNNRVIRDDKNRIVRFLSSPERSLTPNYYYNQYVQVVNNYITYTDTQKIINSILDIKNQEVFSELEESHKACINFLQQYHYSKNHQIVQKLNEVTLLAISKYQIKLINYLKTEFHNIDRKKLLDTCWSYLDLIKIYKLSSYWYHNSNTLDYQQVNDFIKEVFIPLQKMFEDLVCQYVGVEKEIKTYNCTDSLYMNLFLSRNMTKLEEYSSMDSRFESFSSVISLIASCFESGRRNVHDMQYNKEFHKDFVQKLYDVLFSYRELNNFNELFNPNHDTVLINDQSLKNILFPSLKKP